MVKMIKICMQAEYALLEMLGTLSVFGFWCVFFILMHFLFTVLRSRRHNMYLEI